MKKRVLLIAEDDPLLREVYTKKFTLAGYAVHAVENGRAALDAFPAVRPDALLLDINMPVMDGLTVLERLGSDRACPAIMLTNVEDEASKERADRLGVDGYFVKMHMAVGDLARMVEDVLASRGPAAGNRPGFTLAEILIVMGLMGIISSAVIVAINPARHLGSAADAKRHAEAKGLRDAFYQYLLDHGSYPNVAQIPEGAGNAKPICREGITDASCVNVDALVPDYLVAIPVDPAEQNPLHTGYTLHLSVGRVEVTPAHLANGSSSSSSATTSEAGSSATSVAASSVSSQAVSSAAASSAESSAATSVAASSAATSGAPSSASSDASYATTSSAASSQTSAAASSVLSLGASSSSTPGGPLTVSGAMP